MDYSLLLCIERQFSISLDQEINGSIDRKLSFIEELNDKHFFTFQKNIYHVAIIDYLQEWNINKISERLLKTVIL